MKLITQQDQTYNFVIAVPPSLPVFFSSLKYSMYSTIQDKALSKKLVQQNVFAEGDLHFQ